MGSTTDKDSIFLKHTISFLKDFLRMVASRVMEFSLILAQIKVFTKEDGKWEQKMETEITFTVQISITMENGRTIKNKVMGFMHLLEGHTMDNGAKIEHLVGGI